MVPIDKLTPDHVVIRLGIDTGGTFTDFIGVVESVQQQGFVQIVAHKEPSTPDNPATAIIAGVRNIVQKYVQVLPPEQIRLIINHGSTVVTNAILENKLQPVHYWTTAGFEDVLLLGRQNRSKMLTLTPSMRVSPAHISRGLPCRTLASGEVVSRLSDNELQKLVAAIDSTTEVVAINLLHAHQFPEEEARIAAALRDHGVLVSVSHECSPLIGEYERGVTTAVNAGSMAKISEYLRSLEELDQIVGEVALSITHSAGGTMTTQRASQLPVTMALSGPAGGIAAARKIADLFEHAMIAFDVGGTSTDVGWVDPGSSGCDESYRPKIAELTLDIPALAIQTVGAGGGSKLQLTGDGFRVGPESAGAKPGPVTYDSGGVDLTVTDIQVLTGFIPRELFVRPLSDETLSSTREFARDMAQTLGLNVEQFLIEAREVVISQMESAIRLVSVAQGKQPADASLLAYGGGGAMWAAEVADKLGMSRVVIPVAPGLFSAVGMAGAPNTEIERRAVPVASSHELWCDTFAGIAHNLGWKVAEQVDEIVMQYRGQHYPIAIRCCESARELFAAEFEQRHGYTLSRPIDALYIQRTWTGERYTMPPATDGIGSTLDVQVLLPDGQQNVRAIHRNTLKHSLSTAGPCLIYEMSTVCWVPAGWSVVSQAQDSGGNLVLYKDHNV